MKIAILLLFLSIMLHLQFAISHYFDGKWFVIPLCTSIGFLMLVHVAILISETITKIKVENKNEKSKQRN